ncbi:MAG TPA: hypothetical protein VJ454_13255, partial [Steroidobacteraceae bacterium]|nr:hypothetical protein [Steroidobacteraceae bacterium]
VDFISRQRRLGECRRARARPADYRAVHVRVSDCFLEWRATECGNELHLITAAKEDSTSGPNLFDKFWVARIVTGFDQRNRQIARACCAEIG